MRDNRVLSSIEANGQAIGFFVMSPNPEAAEMAGYLGYDFVIIDMEHGAIDYADVLHLLRASDAAQVSPVVRVPHLDPSLIGRVLDAGAHGVYVPRISTREQAEAAVEAARYTQIGGRGACHWTRESGYLADDWTAHTRYRNEQATVWVIVETAEGLANFDEIVTVPGLAGIGIGTFDLAQEMGVGGQVDHPDVVAALRSMHERTVAAGLEIIAVLMGSGDPARAADELDAVAGPDCRIIVTGSDRTALRTTMSTLLDVGRGRPARAARRQTGAPA